MGFFSSNCEGCGHPLLCISAINGINSWMNEGVAITEDSQVIQGFYNGYGTLVDASRDNDYAVGGTNTVWHRACWVQAGSPTDYRGASASSPDQGWFFEEGAHDMAEPRN